MRNRYVPVALLMIANAIVQFDWLTFAPMTSASAAHYGVSTDAIGAFALCFAVVFVLLGIPAGWFIDRYGIRTSARLAGILLFAGATVRAGDGFLIALIGQVLLALAQPLVMSMVSPFAVTRFPQREQMTVISLCMMATFLGLALAFAIVPVAFGAFGIGPTLGVVALVHLVLACGLIFEFGADPARSQSLQFTSLSALLRQRSYLIVVTLIAIGNGYFNGLATWLEQILRGYGIDSIHAGYDGVAVIVGGTLGAIVVPAIAAKIGGLRTIAPPVFVLCLILLPVAIYYPASAYLAFGFLGFALLGLVPILVEGVSEVAGEAHAGFALALFWVAGNAGAFAVMASLPFVARGDDWRPAIWALQALLVVAIPLVRLLPRAARGAVLTS